MLEPERVQEAEVVEHRRPEARAAAGPEQQRERADDQSRGEGVVATSGNRRRLAVVHAGPKRIDAGRGRMRVIRVLGPAPGATGSGARAANARWANARWANARWANVRGANVRGANARWDAHSA